MTVLKTVLAIDSLNETERWEVISFFHEKGIKVHQPISAKNSNIMVYYLFNKENNLTNITRPLRFPPLIL